MIKIINKITAFLFFISILNPLIAMEEEMPPQDDLTIESPLSNLPTELQLHILIMGLKEIIKKNSIFDPVAGVLDYMNAVTFINKEFRNFRIDLDNVCDEIVVNTFASQEQNLSMEQLNNKIWDALSLDYRYSNNLSKEQEEQKEKKAASLIIARGSANDLSIPICSDYGSECPPIIAGIVKTGKFKKLMQLSIFYGADINSIDIFHDSALLIAIARQDEEAVALLLKKGADINVITDRGLSALDIAKSTGNAKIISLIKEHQNLPEEQEFSKENEASYPGNFIKNLSCTLY